MGVFNSLFDLVSIYKKLLDTLDDFSLLPEWRNSNWISF